MKTIGILSWFVSAEDLGSRLALFVQELRRLGYEEGRNVRFDSRFAAGSTARAKQYAEEFVRIGVDLVIAIATPAALQVKAATQTIPIVFLSADPEGSGLVSSIRRPGGNLTGVSTQGVEASVKRVEFARAAIPGLHKLGFLGGSFDPNAERFARQTESASRSLGIDFESFIVKGSDDFRAAFTAAAQRQVQALIVQPIFPAEARALAALAREFGLPLIGDNRSYAEAGFPLVYGSSQDDLYLQLARYTDAILKGTKAGDLPVYQPTEFRLFINRSAANAIGLRIPTSVVVRAEEVIE